MEKDQPTETKFKLGQYVVLYFDLMGVRQSLFNGIDYHSSEVSEDKQKEIDRTSDTILGFLNGIQELHDMFKENASGLYDLFMKDASEYATPNHKEEFLRQAERISVGIQQGSDTTLLYIRDDCEAAQMIITEWMVFLPLYIIAAMSKGVLVRGCLARGTAWEIRKDCLFGPVIHEAAQIEKCEAKYPRIIATPQYCKMCADTMARLNISKPLPTNPINPFKMLSQDYDEKMIFDYLGPIALAGLNEIFVRKGYGLKSLEALVNGARDYVQYSCVRYKSDEKLSDIYQKLCAYFDERLKPYIVTERVAVRCDEKFRIKDGGC